MSADRETLLALLAEAREALERFACPPGCVSDFCGYDPSGGTSCGGEDARKALSRIDDALAADVEARG